MKTAIFNFLVLQVVVWAFVFSANESNEPQQVNYASLSDTWEVAQVGDNSSGNVFMHYPTFNKLTLNLNGTFIRLRDDETIEEGTWKIDDEKTRLTLFTDIGIQNFEIIQMPSVHSESFIIKESIVAANAHSDIRYELTRL